MLQKKSETKPSPGLYRLKLSRLDALQGALSHPWHPISQKKKKPWQGGDTGGVASRSKSACPATKRPSSNPSTARREEGRGGRKKGKNQAHGKEMEPE
jgi:hypothetical protein